MEHCSGLSAHFQLAYSVDHQLRYVSQAGISLDYYPSRDLSADTPATQSQQRQLFNWGVKADIETTNGRNTLKYGIDLKETRLLENFQFGVTDPAFNSPCVDSTGVSIGDPTLVGVSQCAGLGYLPNQDFSQALLPFDLTRGGNLFNFHATQNINQYAFYVQDNVTLGNLQLNAGFRLDHYDGLVTKTGPEPRAGLAYNIKKTRTVLRAAYARTFETPFNENLLLSSATGAGGLAQNVFGSNSVPIEPGSPQSVQRQDFSEAIGKYILLDADYFWKYTHNAYDFQYAAVDTTITFPISWHTSKLDGVTGRLSTTNIHGFQAVFDLLSHAGSILLPGGGRPYPHRTPLNGSVFRIDHDQAFQSTVNLRYQRPKNAEWIRIDPCRCSIAGS